MSGGRRAARWALGSVVTRVALWAAVAEGGAAALSFFPAFAPLRDALVETQLTKLRSQMDRTRALWQQAVEVSRQDALTLAHLNEALALLRASRIDAKDLAPEASISTRNRLERELTTWVSRNPAHLQARIIRGSDGRELVRVQRAAYDAPPRTVATSELQVKADEPYFERAMRAQRQQPLVSGKPTWNREHGRIQEPRVLMLRHTVTLFDADGGPLGFLVLNIDVLNQLRALLRSASGQSASYAFVLTNEGSWVLPPTNASGQKLTEAEPLTNKSVTTLLGSDWRTRAQDASTAFLGPGESSTGQARATRQLVALERVALRGGDALWFGLLDPWTRNAGVIRQTLLRSLVFALAGAALVAALAAFGVGRMLRPLSKLTQRAASFGRADNTPATVRDGNELQQLTREFDQMMTRVTQDREALRRAFEDEQQAKQALEVALARMEAANTALESFAHSVAHDLRAPVRALRFYRESLQEALGDDLSPDAQRELAGIADTTDRMGALIEGLLRLSRLQRVEMHNERINLSSAFQTALHELAGTNPSAEVTIENGLEAFGDPALLTDAVNNLLDNALKYSARSPNPRIEIGRCATARGDAFFVRDNGVGFNPMEAKRIFSLFERGRTARVYGGVGVGLATTQRIIELHGGQIWGESEEGKGATFYFVLGASAAR